VVNTRASGQAAEQAACLYLQQQGLRLLQRNWRCRTGELDLIMLERDTLVFVEVRYRSHSGWGGAAASVDARKRSKLISAAQQFLQSAQQWSRHPCRFDVVCLGSGSSAPDWIKNAFDC
jgi:putative endonuclease